MTTGGWVGLDHLMKPADVAEHLSVSAWTVAKLRRLGELPAVRIGNAWRFDPADVATYINNQRSEPNDNDHQA